MQKLVPNIWYDKQVHEAVDLYVSTFPNSKVDHVTTLHDTPSGSGDIVTFTLAGQEFQGMDGGPFFKLNPSISLHVKCSSKAEIDIIWNKLSQGGQVLMELGAYPFSERYGWLQDRFGLSWQIIYAPGSEPKPKITPVIMFSGSVYAKAGEAVDFWTSTFRQAKAGSIQRYDPGEEPNREGTVKYGEFSLFGVQLGAMDSGYEHKFGFNEAFSFIVYCDNQAEIDAYWDALSAVPEAEACGWLKDKFGVSWQIVPTSLDAMMRSRNQPGIDRVTQALMPMKKLDVAVLRKAYEGK